jgi:hypothetical protein
VHTRPILDNEEARPTAAVPSSMSRALKAGSHHARATTRAPCAGVRASMASTARRMSSAVKTALAMSSSRTAISIVW